MLAYLHNIAMLWQNTFCLALLESARSQEKSWRQGCLRERCIYCSFTVYGLILTFWTISFYTYKWTENITNNENVTYEACCWSSPFISSHILKLWVLILLHTLFSSHNSPTREIILFIPFYKKERKASNVSVTQWHKLTGRARTGTQTAF